MFKNRDLHDICLWCNHRSLFGETLVGLKSAKVSLCHAQLIGRKQKKNARVMTIALVFSKVKLKMSSIRNLIDKRQATLHSSPSKKDIAYAHFSFLTKNWQMIKREIESLKYLDYTSLVKRRIWVLIIPHHKNYQNTLIFKCI